MDIEFFREYCLSKQAVTEELPFDESTLVFKVFLAQDPLRPDVP